MIFNEDVDVVDNDGVNSISNSTFWNFGRTTSLDGTKTLLPPNDAMICHAFMACNSLQIACALPNV